MKFELYKTENGNIIKSWTRGVLFEEDALEQIKRVADLPFIHQWISVMPDVHLGIGATVGSVIPTYGAIIPAAVGVDIGCGMMAQKLSIKGKDLPDNLKEMRSNIEKAVPHGRSKGRNFKKRDIGSWKTPPKEIEERWGQLVGGFKNLCEKHTVLENTNNLSHLGTLGTGNHFIEVCLDEENCVWVMLHSGSRGVGNRIGTYFIELAKKDMERRLANLPHKDLAYYQEGSEHFDDYLEAVDWAQNFARLNREAMMERTLKAISDTKGVPPFILLDSAINCHHNYVNKEIHFRKEVFVTRKGSVSAQEGQLGIIPGSMGAKSFIVRGLGNPDSFCSCSHGAGRVMSRTKAKSFFSLEEHRVATSGVECKKDASVIDETPGAYKPIEMVMDAQSDLVEVLFTLKQVICVKG